MTNHNQLIPSLQRLSEKQQRGVSGAVLGFLAGGILSHVLNLDLEDGMAITGLSAIAAGTVLSAIGRSPEEIRYDNEQTVSRFREELNETEKTVAQWTRSFRKNNPS